MELSRREGGRKGGREGGCHSEFCFPNEVTHRPSISLHHHSPPTSEAQSCEIPPCFLLTTEQSKQSTLNAVKPRQLLLNGRIFFSPLPFPQFPHHKGKGMRCEFFAYRNPPPFLHPNAFGSVFEQLPSANSGVCQGLISHSLPLLPISSPKKTPGRSRKTNTSPFRKGNISCWFSSPTFFSELLNKGGKKRPGHGPSRARGRHLMMISGRDIRTFPY